MATVPGAFFGETTSNADLGFLLANIKNNLTFDKEFFGPGNGSKKDDIFYIENGDKVKGGKGYDVVVQSADENGKLGTLKLDKSTEGGVLTGNEKGNIFGNEGKNNLVGNDGDNVLKGKDGKDVLIGNDGDDKLIGGTGKDTLSGGEGDDILKGGTGNDKLYGFAGDDKLFGAEGKDTLIGGLGNDTLFGGAGKDLLTGDEGADVFGFLKGEKGLDVITDFEAGVDKIDLSDFSTKFEKLKFKDNGDDVIVTVGSGKLKFKLLGYHASDIDSSFFQF
jgi:Ca2+-binding RTX toxin-like protein